MWLGVMFHQLFNYSAWFSIAYVGDFKKPVVFLVGHTLCFILLYFGTLSSHVLEFTVVRRNCGFHSQGMVLYATRAVLSSQWHAPSHFLWKSRQSADLFACLTKVILAES